MASDGQSGIEISERESPEVVIINPDIPDVESAELIKKIRGILPGIQVILVATNYQIHKAIQALNEGVLDYIEKPINPELISLALGRAREMICESRRTSSFPTILLAEDDEVIRDPIAAEFEEMGWKVFKAADGQEAIEIFGEQKIDIALLDIRMPKVDGLEVLRNMRDITDDFEAVVITGYGDEKSVTEALRSGAMGFIRKPVDLDQLIAMVEEATNRLQTRRSLRYRTRDLELAHQIIAKITAESEIVVDVRNSANQGSWQYAQQLLNSIPLGLIVVRRDKTVAYTNHKLIESVGYEPHKLDEKFVSSLHSIGIRDLNYGSLTDAIERSFESPFGTINSIRVGSYSYIILTTATIHDEQGRQKVVILMVRGERADE
jgi:DNA-binding response OmpR family regulator